MAAPTWPICEKSMGEPFSLLIVVAKSSRRPPMSSLSFWSESARASGPMATYAPLSISCRPASTALSMSAAVASGTDPTSSSVAGEWTSMRSLPAGSTHAPPM